MEIKSESEDKLHVIENNDNVPLEKDTNVEEKESTPLEEEANGVENDMIPVKEESNDVEIDKTHLKAEENAVENVKLPLEKEANDMKEDLPVKEKSDDVEKEITLLEKNENDIKIDTIYTIPVQNEANCEKKATTNDVSESTEMPEKGEVSDHQNDEQAESEPIDKDTTIGALNTQVKLKRKRKRRTPRSRKTNIIQSEPRATSPPLKRKRSRPPKSNSTAKRMYIPELPETEVVSDQSLDMSIGSKDDVEYCLTVSNLPNSMSFMEIKNYFDTEVGPVDEIEMIKNDKTGFGAIRLTYQTEKECKEARKKLQGKVVAGNKLTLEMAVVSLESDTETQPKTTEVIKKPWKPDLDFWDVDLEGMYGLKLQYLKSLGITPPLDKWVHVSNFRCDKSELRDVLELAGNVQMCSVFITANRYANVMYSHPLEAVQAVAMLNNQQYYGQQLKVAMDRSPANTILLPKGLACIGSGLGVNGKPLRNVVKHYDRFLDNKECLLNPVAFDVKDKDCVKEMEVKFEVKSVEDFNYPIIHEVTAPSPPVVRTQQPPKPIQTPSPKPKVQAPAYTQMQTTAPVKTTPVTTTPVKTTPVSTQSFIPQTTQQYNAAYNTFVAPTINGGIGQGTTSTMGTSVQNTASFSSPMPPGSMNPVQMVPAQIAPGPMGQAQIAPGPMGTMGPGPGPMGPMGPGPMGQRPMVPGLMGPGPMGPGPDGPGLMGPRPMGPGPMGPRPMGPGPMGQRPMGPGPMGQRPMGPGPMGPGPMGQRPMGPGPMGPGPMGPRPMGPGPMGQRPMGPGPMGPGPGPMGPGPMGPGPMGPGPMAPGQMRPLGPFNNEPVKMVLRNLPPSTTFAILCEKMSEWGHVVCLQLTTPGCAVVTFGNRMQADACFRHYNGRSIDNHVIQMQYA